MVLMKVFLAAPLFNEAERNFNSNVAKRLRDRGFQVWLAQESPFIHEGTFEEKQKIYEEDISALKTCDVVVAVLDGVEVDSGVAFEMGYAIAIGKPIVGLKTDHRAFSKMEDINLMLEVPLIKFCSNIKDVITELKKFSRKSCS
jgi:nucleoside 2-deoxyribosyltransferase